MLLYEDRFFTYKVNILLVNLIIDTDFLAINKTVIFP